MKKRLFYKECLPNGKRVIYFMGHKLYTYYKYREKLIKTEIEKVEIPARYISDDKLGLYLQEKFFERTGKLFDEKLTGLNEKIIWLQMFDASDLKGRLSDKYGVREYVANTIGKKYLIRLLGHWDSLVDFDIDSLPQKFVLKFSEGSGKNCLVPDKNKINQEQLLYIMRKWALEPYWCNFCEMQYKKNLNKYIAEEYIDTKIEYKLWMFHGECRFIKIEIMCGFAENGKTEKQYGKYFYPDWRPADFSTIGDEPEYEIPKPKKLKELLNIATKLASPFSFVRIDFFETQDGELKFGEMTFSPAAGNIHFEPKDKNKQFGEWLTINNNK